MAVLKDIEENVPELSGGDRIESEIFEYVREHPTDDYSDVLARDQRWPVFYHLTDMRENILNWYDFTPDCDVLEIGAGMGAVTGLLCRKAGSVTSVELSAPCARVIEERCKQYDNLTVLVGDFRDMEFSRKFDYITLIGVLEYAPGFIESGDPADFLRRIRGLLKPGGKLLIAVENRFGLKYWCGADENCTGKPFAGINGYPDHPQFRTWSRSDLSNLLDNCGFENKKFSYPLPDYSFPQILFSDDYLPKETVKERIRTYYRGNPQLLADEKQLLSDVIANGAFPFMANSFFVECSPEKIIEPQPVFAAFTPERIPEQQVITKIYADGTVKKAAACPAGEAHLQEILDGQKKYKGTSLLPYVREGDHLEMPFVDAPTLDNILAAALRGGDLEAANRWIDRFFALVLASSKAAKSEDGPLLHDGFLELNFQNCFVRNDELLFFDQEWSEQDVPAKYILYRAINTLYKENTELGESVPLHTLLEQAGIQENEQARYDEMEQAFFRRVLRQTFNPVSQLEHYQGVPAVDRTSYTCACYFDTGSGYSDLGSQRFTINPAQPVSIRAKVPENAVAMRLDPVNERFCTIHLCNAESDKGPLSVVNNVGFRDGDDFFFYTMNPQLDIPLQEGSEWVRIDFELHLYSSSDDSDAISRYMAVLQGFFVKDESTARRLYNKVRSLAANSIMENTRLQTMDNSKELIEKTIRSVKSNGLAVTGRKIKKKIKRKLLREMPFLKEAGGKRVIRDVLFVNGCDPDAAPHPYRYRVLHQMEQLQAAGYSASDLFYLDFDPFDVLNARIIVFYRCPYTEFIGAGIKLAKELNKTVLFDVDDLVIDKKYTDNIPQVQQLSKKDRALYDEGVVRMGATLQMCEAATTTTEGLQRELENYVPIVYINRNAASEQMMKISESVCRKMQAEKKGKHSDMVTVGYFSGSLTHNADFELIKPAVKQILDEKENVRLLLMGEISLPEDMEPYKDKIIRKPFCDWKKLPEVIASVDVNLAPIENTIFNEAKSENKWVEAALVRVPTVASNIGAFSTVVVDNETGFLCSDDAWYDTLSKVIDDAALRQRVADNAWRLCTKEYLTVHRAKRLRDFYDSLAGKHIAFVLPSCEISGGIMVALYHACFLQDNGWEVDIIAPIAKKTVWEVFGHQFSCISREDSSIENIQYYDAMVATMWTTLEYVQNYPRVNKRCYLVQGYETDLYDYNMPERLEAEATYCIRGSLIYMTVSKWCEKWLKEKYGQSVLRVRNGIRLENYKPVRRTLDNKIRILIEGDCAVDYKNIDESFAITDKLDRDRFEVWYMSYNAKPKASYHYDKFLHAIPYDEVGRVYEQCDILLKSSWLESFSYPPLEMMATGGFCVVAPNGGNAEYLVDGENCLLYERGNLDSAVEAINRIVNDEPLRGRLYANGLETARSRDWEIIRKEILEMYGSIL